ncbi:trem-like transcript 1 protein [Rhynchocyon petersi]
MGPNLLLLLLLTLAGQLVDSLPEVLRVPVGGSILVQCHYRLQDVRARKVWCRFLEERCSLLASSAVDRGVPSNSRVFLTDMGGGLLQVEMINLWEQDAGEYGCVVDGAAGPQTLHRIYLEVLPPAPGVKEEETSSTSSLTDEHSPGPMGSSSPLEPRQDEKSIPLIWGAVLLLGLLMAVVVVFAVMAKRKGNRLAACGRLPPSIVPGMGPYSVGNHTSDSGLAADLPSDVPYVKLDSPPSFDNTTYTSLPLDPPSRKPPLPPPSPPLPCSKTVTYATVIFPKGDKGGGASCEPAQNPLSGQTLPS